MYNPYLYPRRFHYLKGYVPFLVYFHILLILCILQSLSIDSNFFVNKKSSSVSIFGRFGNRSMLHSSLDTTLLIMQSLSLLSSMFLEMQWNAVTKEISICDSSKSYFSNQSFRSCNFIKKETLTEVFSCEFCEICKNTFFYGKPLVPASGRYNALCSCFPCSNSESLSKESSSTMGEDEGDLFGKE